MTGPLEAALIASLDHDALARASRAATEALIGEVHHLDPALARRLEPTLNDLAAGA